MKGTIVISGIRGFLGRNLYSYFKDDYQLYGIGSTAEKWSGIDVFSSDRIEEIAIVPDFLILCHAAVSSGQTSQSNELLFDVNVSVTEKIIKKFSSSKIIYISSASIYDSNSDLIQEKTVVNPLTDYAVSKLWAELLISKIPNAVIVRLSSLYGKGMKENTIIPNYINQALQNGLIEVWGKGERKQNYIHVTDVCICLNTIINNFDAIKSKLLLAVSKAEYSNTELAQIIVEETGATLQYVNDDHSKSLYYNNDLTCKLLGWEPKLNFKDEIISYIKWKKKQF